MTVKMPLKKEMEGESNSPSGIVEDMRVVATSS